MPVVMAPIWDSSFLFFLPYTYKIYQNLTCRYLRIFTAFLVLCFIAPPPASARVKFVAALYMEVCAKGELLFPCLKSHALASASAGEEQK